MILPMTTKKFEIQVLNQISQIGLRRFPQEGYHVSKDVANPDAILVRSQDMHGMTIPDSRAGDRPRRRGHEQYPGEGDEPARRARSSTRRGRTPTR